jgi:hypothetical protein
MKTLAALALIAILVSGCDLLPDSGTTTKAKMDKIVDQLTDQVSAAGLAPRVAVHSHLPSLKSLRRELEALDVPDGSCGMIKLVYLGHFDTEIMRLERFAARQSTRHLDNISGPEQIAEFRQMPRC